MTGMFRTRMILGFLALAVPLVQPAGSEAVPAFARREGVSCQMCHLRVPELNADGRAYVLRGFREAGAATGGGSTLGEPVTLQGADYVSFMGTHAVTVERHTRAHIDAGGVDVLIGGALGDRWSAFANPAFDAEGGGADVEQAYAQYYGPGETTHLSARGGQLLPLSILVNQGGPAMSLSTPEILESPTRDEVPWTPATLLRGAELGLVNDSHGSVYAGVAQPHMDVPDAARHTDLFASAECLVGSRGDAVSALGYFGKLPANGGGPEVSYQRAMLFADLYAGAAKGVAGALWARDKATDEDALITRGGFLLAEALVGDRWSLYGRMDYVHREIPAADAETTAGPAFGLSWWADTEAVVTVESQFLKTTGAERARVAEAALRWIF